MINMTVSEKTSLTNPAVQGSAETDTSLQRQGNDGLNVSNKDEKGVSWENRAKEYQKKYEATAEKLDSVSQRLEELENKARLTESEKQEKERLENRQDDLEDQIRILETDPGYKAFPEYVKRHSKKVKEEAVSEAYNKFVNETVDYTLKKAGKRLGVEPKELRSELLKIMKVSHQQMSPIERVEVLLEEYESNLAKAKKEKEESLENSKQESESGGRANREKTLEDAKKEGDVISQMKHLGIYK